MNRARRGIGHPPPIDRPGLRIVRGVSRAVVRVFLAYFSFLLSFLFFIGEPPEGTVRPEMVGCPMTVKMKFALLFGMFLQPVVVDFNIVRDGAGRCCHR